MMNDVDIIVKVTGIKLPHSGMTDEESGEWEDLREIAKSAREDERRKIQEEDMKEVIILDNQLKGSGKLIKLYERSQKIKKEIERIAREGVWQFVAERISYQYEWYGQRLEKLLSGKHLQRDYYHFQSSRGTIAHVHNDFLGVKEYSDRFKVGDDGKPELRLCNMKESEYNGK